MNIGELRNTLSNEALLEKDPFGVLSEVASYVNDPKREDQGREFVLRALEKRGYFHTCQEVLDALTREVGLFPYLTEEELSFRDAVAYELHRPQGMEEQLVFHRSQAEIYRRLLDGESIIVSAPTSFGKSRIIDAMIAIERYDNIAVVVPTIALIDETRRRLSSYKDKYKVVTQIGQEPQEKNIFVFTAERLIAYEKLPNIDFFVVDEFYKLGAFREDETRTIALNHAFYRLYKQGGQFYMLGPNIKQIPDGLEDGYHCHFYPTSFTTVASDVVEIFDWDDDLERLVHLATDINEQTLIYCKSPKRVNTVVRALVEGKVSKPIADFSGAVEWVAENFHPDWIYQVGLSCGIGMHHGKLPRSLAQYSVKEFNEGRLNFLVCTSTLIEGVNTKAKNVVILDNIVGGQPYDFFTFNNIKGRSGRMFQHFVGRVYIFHAPPQEELPFVDFPVFTQDEDTPESLLLQLEDEDLRPPSRDRLAGLHRQKTLPVELLRRNAGIDPERQIELAEYLERLGHDEASRLFWKGIPEYGELERACELIWNYLLAGRRARAGVYSAKQLAFKTNMLMRYKDTKIRIEAELGPNQYQAKTADEAVERVLDFDRNWAGFELPRLMMALSAIQQHVFWARYGDAGDYGYFSARLESMFRTPVAVTLEEYGLPMQVTEKIDVRVKLSEEIDAAIVQIKMLAPEDRRLGLSDFEQELLRETQLYV